MQRALIVRVTAPDEGSPSRLYRFAKETVRIGRDPGSDIVLGHRTVSWEHARVLSTGGEFALEDCDSANGTIVDGSALSRVSLHRDVQMIVGPFVLQFEVVDPEPYEVCKRPCRLATVRVAAG